MKIQSPCHFLARRRLRSSSRAVVLSFGLAVAGLLSHSAQATNLYWDSNGATVGAGTTPTGSWGTSNFFNTDSTGGAGGTFQTTTATTDDVFFSAGTDAAGPYTITLSANQVANSLTFEEGAPTLTIGTGTSTQSLTLSSGNITVSPGITALVGSGTGTGAGLAGTNYTKLGNGTLILTGNSALTGNFLVSAGTLQLGNNNANGGALTATTGITVNTGATLAYNRSSATTITYVIGGAGAVNILGAGANFNAVNTYTGDTTISAGTLTIGNATAGTLNSGSYAGGISNAGAFTYASTGNQILSGIISGAGTLTKNTSSVSTLTLSGANTYTGATTISTGTVAGIGANAFGSTSGIGIAAVGILSLRGDASTPFVKASDGTAYAVTTSASGATINVDQATTAGTGAKTMTIGNIGTTFTGTPYQVNFTGANSTSLTAGAVTGPASTAAGTVTLNNTNTTGTTTLASYTSANTAGGETLTFSGTGNTTVSGAITPGTTLAVVKSGTGTLTLSSASTYAGGTSFSNGTVLNAASAAGTIAITNGSALGSGPVAIGSGSGGNDARLQFSNNITVANTMNLGGQPTGVTTARLENVSGNNTISGPINYAVGGGGFTNIVSTGGTLTLSGQLASSITGTAAVRTFEFSGTGNTLVSGNIINSTGGGTQTVGVLQGGAGTLTLSGANTYTGGTTVTGGTLLANYNTVLAGTSSTGAGAVSVTGGTLGGTGRVLGAVSVNSGATLLGGDGTTTTGMLTLAVNPTLSTGSIIGLTLGAGNLHSTLALTGNTFTGFDPSQSFALANLQTGTYDNIITGVASGIVTGSWTIAGAPSGSVYSFSDDGANIDLSVTAVPEPSTLVSGFVLLCVGGGAFLRRNRTAGKARVLHA